MRLEEKEGDCREQGESQSQLPLHGAWCMVRDPPASLHQLWSLSNQKLHLAHPTNVFSSCAAFQSPKPLKIQNLSLINVRSKVTAEREDSLWEPFAPAKRA